ncbi:molybdate transport system ATP-binding protein [Chromohalobacter marismortui]|uniref:Molybdate transport system ATP-binding protein n=1 Tax=Chromohalobacter marismortui TaxID=42055 RepID=A0A4R7NLS5_9GAMM|nr:MULTISPECIES: molybdenum ABC transporter ATP-binding protein [Chromohalobacter]MCI0510160.1 molybdenum ABC transporter ATP-binding protein [Chromohalobacter sp.]MCI0592488.1 molybdenum ABC transporter ATP-binding protein [Chromohalobacter sp.]TDU21577.1 molybdate transport system ATP-binding protein [Chromohalobacter marismortui]
MLDAQVFQRLGDFTLDTSLAVPAEGVTALFGRSGSGKSSLIRLIAGLGMPEVGTIRLGDTWLVDTRRRRWVPPHRRQLGVVFQEARLFPHYSVRGNLRYGMPRASRDAFDDLVDLLGIGHLLARTPGRLSGGEARRVAIGRALLSCPRMLLMDEPLTGLDGARKQELLHYIRRLARDTGVPILFVSHDTREIGALADRVALIEEGRVMASGPVDEMFARLDLGPRTGRFEASSLIEARILAHDQALCLTRLALPGMEAGEALSVARLEGAVGDAVRLRLRARDVGVAPSGAPPLPDVACIPATLREMGDEAHSPFVEVMLDVGGQALRARLSRDAIAQMELQVGHALQARLRSVTVSRHDMVVVT